MKSGFPWEYFKCMDYYFGGYLNFPQPICPADYLAGHIIVFLIPLVNQSLSNIASDFMERIGEYHRSTSYLHHLRPDLFCCRVQE